MNVKLLMAKIQEDLVVAGDTIFKGKELWTQEKSNEDKDRQNIYEILEKLEQVNDEKRLPCVSITCNCENTVQGVSSSKIKVFSSDEGSGTDSDEDDDRFTLAQLLRSIKLFTKQCNKRNPAALQNLVATYQGQEEIEDEQTLEVLSLLKHESAVVQEIGLHTIKQLCVRESNTFKFLYHDVMVVLMNIIQADEQNYLHEAAALVLDRIATHEVLGDLWLDGMMESGLSSVLARLSVSNTPCVRHATLCALRSMATHRNMAILMLDQAMPAILEVKDINTDFKEVFTELLTKLVLHTDHTRACVLDKDSIPIALQMLKQGPCGPQNQALVFLGALGGTDSGLTAILENNSVPYIMSAFIDHNCRRVREAAISALSSMFQTHKPSLQKQLLVQVDQFFHEHEDQLGFNPKPYKAPPPGNYRVDTSSRANRAVEEMVKAIITKLHKEARMDVDNMGCVTQVHLAPCIDVDPCRLNTLRHQVATIGSMAELSMNRIKIPHRSDKEGLKDLRKKHNCVNHHMAKLLLEQGSLCVIDLLHVYTAKLHRTICMPNMNVENLTDVKRLQNVIQAWAVKDTSNVTAKPKSIDLCEIFEEAEVLLISKLVDVVAIFARCSADLYDRCIEEEVKDKLLQHDLASHSGQQMSSKERARVTKKRKTKRDSARESHSPKMPAEKDGRKIGRDVMETVKLWEQDNPFGSGNRGVKDDGLDIGKKAKTEVIDEEELDMKELNAMRRRIRIALFEAGVLESVSPWLACTDLPLKHNIHEVLSCMIQPLEERVMPQPPSDLKSRAKRLPRPPSAMTAKEREQAIQDALQQMSGKIKVLIKKALQPDIEGMVDPVKKKHMPLIQDTSASNKNAAQSVVQKDINDNLKYSTLEGQNQLLKDGTVPGMDTQSETVDGDNTLPSARSVSVSGSMADGTDFNQNKEALPEKIQDKQNQDSVSQISNKNAISEEGVKKKRPQSAKLGVSVSAYTHDSYDQFARCSSRPPSGQILSTTDQTGPHPPANMSQHQMLGTRRPRPQSAKLIKSLSETDATCRSANRPSQCQNLSGAGRPRPHSAKPQLGTPTGRLGCTPRGQGQLLNSHSRSKSEACLISNEATRPIVRSRLLSGNSEVSRRPQSGKSVASQRLQSAKSTTRQDSEKAKKAIENMARELERLGPLPWKPHIDVFHPIAEQCRLATAKNCGRWVLYDLFSGTKEARKASAIFLEQLVHLGETAVHMKLSEQGCITYLVDFLRLGEDDQLLGILGLVIVQMLVSSDIRLRQLFQQQGGMQLLMAMSSYTTGLMRQEVTKTLKTVTRNEDRQFGQDGRRVKSSPPGKVTRGPDVWDHIMNRWQNEDKVMLMLKK